MFLEMSPKHMGCRLLENGEQKLMRQSFAVLFEELATKVLTKCCSLVNCIMYSASQE